MSKPDWKVEKQYQLKGFRLVAGVDEVGRGCLAGPVVAGAVILDPLNIPSGINDSKKLTQKRRETLDKEIRETAIAYAVGVGPVEEIDSINILNSAKHAMVRAVDGLKTGPDFVLVDGNFKIPLSVPQLCVVGGDGKSLSIAAASIIAKVFRDKLMVELDQKYPGYFLASNKGYGSKAHRLGLQDLGPTPIHRKSFNWTPV